MAKYQPPRYLFRRYAILRRVRRGKSFLEIGAGNLRLSSELTKFFDNGTAIDYEEGVKRYYEQLPPEVSKKIKLVIGDIFSRQLKKKYDCVVACEVMEHIEDDEAFLKRIYSLTENGGQVIISVPARQKYWSVHDEAVGHIRRYEKDELAELFRRFDFKKIQVVSYGYPFVNLFRLLRVLHGKQQFRQKKDWSLTNRTKASGVNQVTNNFDALAFIANKYVFALPNIIAAAFDDADLSEGYVVVAEK